MDSGFLAVLTDRMTAHALPLFIQSAAILGAGYAASRAFKLRGPFVQLFALRASVAAVLAISFLSVIVAPRVPSLWHVSIASVQNFLVNPPPDSPDENVSSAQVHPASSKSLLAAHSAPVSIPISVAPDETDLGTIDWSDVFREAGVIVWLTGSILLLGWIVIGQVMLFGLFRASTRVRDGKVVELMQEICEKSGAASLSLYKSKLISGPFLCGIYRSAIFIPENFDAQLNEQQLRAVLAHEIGHAQRSDNMWRLLAQLCASLLWFQPLVWKTLSEMDSASERVCDQLAVGAGCAPIDYADTLLSLASFPQPRLLEQSLGAGAVPDKSRLASRIEELLSFKSLADNPSARFRGKVIVALVGVGIIASVAFSAGSIGGESWATRQYLSNFTLPKQLGYEMAPLIPRAYQSSPGFVMPGRGAPVQIIRDSPIKFLSEADKASFNRMMNIHLANTVYGGRPPVKWLNAAKNELVKSTPKTRFYAEYLISIYYFDCCDLKKSNEYKAKALRDAPMIVAGRIQFNNGAPVVGDIMDLSLRASETTSFDRTGSKDPAPVLGYNDTVTDKKGCFYLPIYPA